MPTIIQTSIVDFSSLVTNDILQVYNGMDCCITLEVLSGLLKSPSRTPETDIIYTFERHLLNPALDMARLGILVDSTYIHEQLKQLDEEYSRVEFILNSFAKVYWGEGETLNPNSHQQVKDMLYGTLKLPKIYNYDQGKKKLSSDRAALEKCKKAIRALPFVNCILACKDIHSIRKVLRTQISRDGRMRTEFKVTGTKTGRWSSSDNAFGEGTNQQNITEKVRKVFIADSDYKMFYADLEQAESRATAGLVLEATGDSSYLEACESKDDLHTSVTRMIWPELNWADDPLINKKEIASQIFYRHHSYRHMAKTGGHATNYYGSPYALAAELKIEKEVAEDFQDKYFRAFPGIREWHLRVAQQLQTTGILTTPFHRRRQFFDRLWDPKTLKSAIAFVPQSMVADILNLGLLRLWRHFSPELKLFLQVHDAVGGQYKIEKEEYYIHHIVNQLEVPFTIANREIIIPVEVATGWNWSKHNPASNPDGLKTWTGYDDRTRQKDPALSMFRRSIH